jgi:DNA-directed RNA polymerase subunit RPC12/RpoP
MKTPDSGPKREVLIPGKPPRIVVQRPPAARPVKPVVNVPAGAPMKHHSEFAGSGCVVQGLGLLAPVVGLLGGLVGFMVGCGVCLALLVVGSQQAVKLLCGHCGNKLDNKHVTLCPSCKGKVFYQPKSLAGFVFFMFVAVVIIKWAHSFSPS